MDSNGIPHGSSLGVHVEESGMMVLHLPQPGRPMRGGTPATMPQTEGTNEKHVTSPGVHLDHRLQGLIRLRQANASERVAEVFG